MCSVDDVESGLSFTCFGMGVFATLGIAYGGLVAFDEMNATPQMLDGIFLNMAVILVLSGATIVLCLLRKVTWDQLGRNNALFPLLNFISGIIFLLSFVVGCLWITRGEWEVQRDIERVMSDKLRLYPTDLEAKKSWDKVQENYCCCGIEHHDDWLTIMDSVPQACMSGQCNGNFMLANSSSTYYYEEGCLQRMAELLQRRNHVASGLVFYLSGFSMAGAVLSATLLQELWLSGNRQEGN